MRGVHANGKQIKAARVVRGWTQEQLAASAGVDAKTVRKAERDQRLDIGTLTKLGFALELNVSALIIPNPSPTELEIRRRDAILRWHRAWDAQDIEGLLSVYDDSAVLRLPGGPDIPFAGVHSGKEAIRRVHEIAWSTCETDPVSSEDFNLLASDNSVILSGKKGIRLPSGGMVKLTCLQIFTFHEDGDLVIDQLVEYDTLNFARLLQLPAADGPEPPAPQAGVESETSR